MRIASHHVDVTINNGFARTEVDQLFANDSSTPLEGQYSFPLPKQASLSELSLWIDGREIVGEVIEKERAKAIYEDEKQQGRQTALAEKNDYKTFDVRIGNVPAAGDVRVRLVYYQPLEIDLNVGRYLYPLAEGNVDEERNAFWSTDDRVDGIFQFNLQLKSAFPVKDVYLPGLEQEAVVNEEEGRYTVAINRSEGSRLNKDIVFYYRLDDQNPARVELIPYKEDPSAEGSFMLVVTPAADLKPITEGTDWTFVLDVSGSMGGEKIATLTRGVGQVIKQMKGTTASALSPLTIVRSS